ncbi:ubiquitin family protein [Moniliophthora roreri MCA 2997]|uniref:Ubiquitin family protein n=1 Tax=Moniliophthora roreri (strain MCA 2997) TaxID=1381753 RepID=V2X5F1_MONRO|nr:ubiquitin family protein [Moniliophthora roreri MCA 2997]
MSTPRPKNEETNLVLFCDGNGSKRVIVRRPMVYSAATACAQTHFPKIALENLVFLTDQLAICQGERAEVTPDTWAIVVKSVSCFYVVDRTTERGYTCSETCNESSVSSGPTDNSQEIKLKLKFCFFSWRGNTQSLDNECTVPSSMAFKEIFEAYETHIRKAEPGRPAYLTDDTQISYHFENKPIFSEVSKCPRDLNMEDGAVIECYPVSKVFGLDRPFAPTQTLSLFPSTPSATFRKPVIYLFSPKQIEANVSVSLVPQWSFAATYPVVAIKSSPSARLHQQVQWRVQTQPDGTLKQTDTGLNISYLFWEASTNSDAPLSPPSSPLIAHQFIPSQADVQPHDSVVLSVDALPPYLEKALFALGLHTEARSSFITYWLPSFLKHKHVALRFVNQASYELAAPLEIMPQPDVITRVFMLFKGVSLETGGWDAASQRADLDPVLWRDVVGVDIEKIWDDGLFRALEWGGMEVRE